ncbi:zinc ribbon domain-containing protein [Burkholderia ubonensis]|uniref:zinc ribbon domain-containing protein n=1 Tax=Burkholderia ubonensis TaxID=101571 RepID=UPI000A9F49F0|nr:zinc ribbon domain-containing protein [Burkholderia ubonensis]
MTTADQVFYHYNCSSCGHAGQAHSNIESPDRKPAYCDSCDAPVTLELASNCRH